MRKLRTAIALVGVAAAVAAGVAASGCGSPPPVVEATEAVADFETAIRETVSDPAKADEAIAAVGEFRELLQKAIDSRKGVEIALAKMNRDYDTPREDFDKLFTEYDKERAQLRQGLYTAHRRFANATTDEQWEALADNRDETLVALVAASTLGKAAEAEPTEEVQPAGD